MNSVLMNTGCIVAVAGSLAAALFALWRHPAAHRFSQAVLALSGLAGAVAAVAYLLSGNAQLVLFSTNHFYGMNIGLDPLSAIFFAIVCLIASLAAMYATRYVEHVHPEPHDARSVDFLTALFVFGMQGVLLANNAVGFLFFWEIMSIAPFFLVMAHKEETSMRAALFYLVMTHLGAGALLAGFALASNGHLFGSYGAIAAASASVSPTALAIAFALFLFGFGSKAGLVPFHVWLPEAHPEAPSHVSALMSGVMLKVAVYGFLRVLFLFFQGLPAGFAIAVIVIGLLSAIYGVLYAVVERDVKRTLAFSSIENIGLIFTMIGTGMLAHAFGLPRLAFAALVAAVFQCACHAVFKSGLFMGAGIMIQETGTRSLEGMGGLAKRMPLLSAAMLVLALGAAALPPLGAFAGEWYFLQALVQTLEGAPLVERFILLAILCGFALVAGLAVYAMIKLFGIGFLGAPRTARAEQAKEPSASMLVPVALCALVTVLLGVAAAPLMTGLVTTFTGTNAVLASSAMYNPAWVAAILALAFVLVLFARARLSDPNNERAYHTWDCGQPITPHNQYSATAFSGPIRFMFRPFLRIKKRVVATPLIAGNPWIANRELVLNLRSIWYDDLYAPIMNATLWIASRVKRIQNGVIQVYIGLILLALVITMLVAL